MKTLKACGYALLKLVILAAFAFGLILLIADAPAAEPMALKLALSQEAAWSAMRSAVQYSEHEKKIPLAAADYQALYVWVSNGCWGELDSNKAREVASLQEVQAAIAPFRPGLAPAIPKVVGTK